MAWPARFFPWRAAGGPKIRVAVVGNCQARPMAALLSLMNPGIEVRTVAVVHLLRDEEEAAYAPLFREADFILSQHVADTYPCAFVRTSELRQRYGSKLLLWLNLYFRGYNPELFVLRMDGRTPLRGPLGDYHCRAFFEGWQQELPVREILARHGDPEYNRERYAAVPEASLAELQRREELTQTRILPVLRDLVWKQRLFFTFNHPSWALLEMLAASLLELMGLSAAPRRSLRGSEPLGMIRIPLNPWVRQAHDLKFPEDGTWTGLKVRNIGPGTVTVGKRKVYAPEDLVRQFFAVYDAHRAALQDRQTGGAAVT